MSIVDPRSGNLNPDKRRFLGLMNKKPSLSHHDMGGGGGSHSNDGQNDDLRSIKYSEVKLAKQIIVPQLYSESCLTDIHENFICTLDLDANAYNCTPQIIGRVVDIFPERESNVYKKPIELVSIRVPRKSRPSSIVDIPAKIIKNYPMPASWYVKIPVLASSADLSDLEGSIDDFYANGIYLDIRIDIEDIQDSIYDSNGFVPWIVIVTSEWLSAQRPSAYRLAITSLRNLLFEHNTSVINHHPRNGIVLNEVAGYLSRRSTRKFLDSYSIVSLKDLVNDELDILLDRPLDTYIQ